MAKIKFVNNGKFLKKATDTKYGICKKCSSELFSMEYVYNNGICNRCLRPKKDE